MNIKRTALAFAVLSGMAHLSLLAQTGAPLLTDADWLATHLNDRGLVVLYVGAKAEYTAHHIPGARYIAMEDVSLPMDRANPKALMLELPPPQELRAKLAAMGVSDNSRIVVTYGKDGPFQSATRVVFTLDYLGLGDQTSVLNGGDGAWTKAGKTMTDAVPEIAPGKLSNRATKDVVASATLVQSLASHKGYKLVDARAPVFFQGKDASFGKTGHIPGAVSIPFNQITGPTLTVDRQHLAEVFREAGIKEGDTLVAYCHVGQQATAVVFAARVLGHRVMMYDGSFQDWVINNRGTLEP